MSNIHAQQNILLLGSEGLIGQHIRRRLNELEKRFMAVDIVDGADLKLDLLDFDSLRRHIQETKPTHVINLAALSNNAQCLDRPELVFRLNTLLPILLLDTLEATGAEALIHASTEWIYGPGNINIKGASEPEGFLGKAHDQYSKSKLEAEVLLKSLVKNRCKVIALRLGIVYGSELRESGCIVDLLVRSYIEGEMTRVKNRSAGRCFISANDVAAAFITACSTDFSHSYNSLDVQGPCCHTLGSIEDYILGADPNLNEVKSNDVLSDCKLVFDTSESMLGGQKMRLDSYIDTRLGRA